MFTHYKTHGIVIKKKELRESDLLFIIYTENFGKIKVIGKSIRKIKSKLRSGMDLFYLSEISFVQGKSYKILTDVFLIDKFNNLRKNLKKIIICYKITEIIDKLIRGEEPDKKFWKTLKDFFIQINNLEPDNPFETTRDKEIELDNKLKNLYYYYFWNFFSLAGYEPELYNCSFCQKKAVPLNNYYDLKEGGIICYECFLENKKIIKNRWVVSIESDTIKILRLIFKKNWKTFSMIKIDDCQQKNIEKISEFFLKYKN